jgi:hypothetical protein
MSGPNPSAPEEGSGSPVQPDDALQFEQAEYATSPQTSNGPVCAVCQRTIPDAYFEVSGKVVCTTCRDRLEATFRGGRSIARGLKAMIFGTAAAAAGAVLYYAIMKMTGYNIGLVAIVVGFMVGAAVRKGSGNCGGAYYQAMAVFLTYSAIVAMHVPFALEAFQERNRQNPQAALLILIGLFYSIPVMIAFHAPISGLIFGFALWEAWKINKMIRPSFNGPFRVAAQPPAH